mgnify:CR=1 FL=1
MITKAYIKGKVANSNKYSVRVPLFENSLIRQQYIMEATLITTPGTYNSYNIGDVVYVSFEEDSYEKCVILGLMSKEGIEDNEPRGYSLVNTLKVSNKVTLPKNTKIVDIDYDTLKQLINRVQNLEDEVKELRKKQ